MAYVGGTGGVGRSEGHHGVCYALGGRRVRGSATG
jgi:hypothetical protein